MNIPPTDTNNAQAAASEAKRFTYPGGSRPLDGFTIKRGVGHGGFGEVYYATSDAGKEVALKLIRRSLDVELRGIKQCLNLKHPNLLGVFDIKEDSRGDHWVVMEYVAGECLDDVIARHPDGMPPNEALAWLAGIAAGVGYLHDHGIVHRDLKPGNIFSEEGRVSIGDYGLSKFISCSRRSGHTESVGTVHYMAPEVANGRYGKEIDIYALGIILYEMLTGRVPFEGESVGEVLMKHLTAKPDVSMIAEPYQSVIARALEKDPDKRFSSVDEMLARLPVNHAAGLLPHARVTQAATAPRANGSAKAPVPQPAQPAASPPVIAHRVDDEPILRELRSGWSSLRDWWRGLNPGPQVAVTILIVLGLIATFSYWIPLGFFALVAYGIYRLVRAILLVGRHPGDAGSPATPFATGETPVPPAPAGGTPFAPGPTPVAAAAQPASSMRKHYRRWRPYEQPARALIVKPPVERLADLLGSMLLAAVVATIMTLVVGAITAALSWQIPVEVFAFILLVSLAGAWAVLVPSKFWEGTDGDSMVRRLVMMTAGIALGALAFGAMQWLCVSPGQLERFPEIHFRFVDDIRGPVSHPLASCLVVFGTLMLVIRWWLQADPLRRVRMSLWSMAARMAAAALVALVWQAHGWALVTIAGVMSIAIQVASPWINPRLRQPNPEV